jgi:transposase
MPTISQKTPHRIARMIGMHERGASTREMADELKVSHTTIAGWLRDAGLEPNGGNGARKGRKRGEPSPESAEMAEAARELEELGTPPIPRSRDEALAHVRARLAMAAKLLEQQARGVPTGASNPSTLYKLGQWERELRAELAELTPREDPDPDKDPTNLEAAAEVRREIDSLVSAIERVTVCEHCGKNPFHKGGA